MITSNKSGILVFLIFESFTFFPKHYSFCLQPVKFYSYCYLVFERKLKNCHSERPRGVRNLWPQSIIKQKVLWQKILRQKTPSKNSSHSKTVIPADAGISVLLGRRFLNFASLRQEWHSWSSKKQTYDVVPVSAWDCIINSKLNFF